MTTIHEEAGVCYSDEQTDTHAIEVRYTWRRADDGTFGTKAIYVSPGVDSAPLIEEWNRKAQYAAGGWSYELAPPSTAIRHIRGLAVRHGMIMARAIQRAREDASAGETFANGRLAKLNSRDDMALVREYFAFVEREPSSDELNPEWRVTYLRTVREELAKEPARWQVRVGPLHVKPVASALRRVPGMGEVSEGTEHVYFGWDPNDFNLHRLTQALHSDGETRAAWIYIDLARRLPHR